MLSSKIKELDDIKTATINITNSTTNEYHDISKRDSILEHFQLIHTSCQGLLNNYLSIKKEIDEKFEECKNLCKIIVEKNIPEIEQQIITCIRTKIKNKLDNSKRKLDPIKDKLTSPNGEFPSEINKGTELINDITSLLGL